MFNKLVTTAVGTVIGLTAFVYICAYCPPLAAAVCEICFNGGKR